MALANTLLTCAEIMTEKFTLWVKYHSFCLRLDRHFEKNKNIKKLGTCVVYT